MSSFAFNPFAQLLNPDALQQALNTAPTLSKLEKRVHRPLDKPSIPLTKSLQEFDAAVEMGHAVHEDGSLGELLTARPSRKKKPVS